MQGIRHHKESFFHTRFWIGVLIVITIFLLLSVFKTYRKYTHAREIRNEYQAELVQTQAQQMQLQKNIDALSTDRGKEAEIRDRYRVVKEGEQMILIVDNEQREESAPTEAPQGVWERFTTWTRGIF